MTVSHTYDSFLLPHIWTFVSFITNYHRTLVSCIHSLMPIEVLNSLLQIQAVRFDKNS